MNRDESKLYLQFFFYVDFYFGGYVAEDFYRDRILAEGLDGFLELELALVDFEILRGEGIGDVAGGHRAEELVVLAGLTGEVQRDAIDDGGLLLRGIELGGGFLGQGVADALEGFHVSAGGFDGHLAGEQKIAGVAGLYGDYVAAVAEFFDVFLKDDLHGHSLCSCFLILGAAGSKPARHGRRPLRVLCSVAVLRFKIASCLLLKSGSFASRTPKLTDLKIGHYTVADAATFLALRLPVALLLALGLLVLPAVLGRRVVLLLARGNLARLLVLLGAGRGCLRRCRRRALARCCGRA